MQTMTAPNLAAARNLAAAFEATGYVLSQSRPNGYVLRNGASILAIKVQA